MNALAARKVHSLNFRADLRPDEVLSFLRVFSLAPGEFTRKQTFADRLRSEGVFNIEALETQPAAVIDAPAPKRRRAEAAAMPSEMSDGAFFGDFIRRLLRSDPFLDGEDAAQFRHRVDFELMSRQASMDFDFVGSLFADAFNEWTGLSKISHVGSRLRPVEPEAAAARIANLAEQVRLTVAAIHQVTNPRWRTRWSEGMVLVLAPLHGRVLAAVFAEDYPADVTFDLVANLMMRLTDEQKHQIVEAYDDEIGRLVKGLRPADFELDIARVKRIADVLGGIKNILPAKEHSPFSAKLQLLIGHVQLLARTEGAVERFLAVKSKRLLAQHPSFFIQKEFLDQFASLVQRFLRAGRARDIRDMMNQAAVNFGAEDWNAKAVTVQAFDRMHREIVKLLHPELLKVGFTILCARVYEGRMNRSSAPSSGRWMASCANWRAAAISRRWPSCSRSSRTTPMSSAPADRATCFRGLSSALPTTRRLSRGLPTPGSRRGTTGTSRAFCVFCRAKKIFEHVLVLLRDAADMRTRKKCTLLIQKFGTEAVEFVVRELREENFWFYNRNLINLLGEIGDRRAASALVLTCDRPRTSFAGPPFPPSRASAAKPRKARWWTPSTPSLPTSNVSSPNNTGCVNSPRRCRVWCG
ncbi:MAG: hypothetical protein M5R36_05265 [Deltaproteobacteria bacterium]|nr:hypothetical protein [Deltaproteobacteria bacterium]